VLGPLLRNVTYDSVLRLPLPPGVSMFGFADVPAVSSRSIFDSRGNPTVEIDLTIDNELVFRAAVSSGFSTGILEALELRNNDKSNYLGKEVNTAVNNINNIIAPTLTKEG